MLVNILFSQKDVVIFIIGRSCIHKKAYMLKLLHELIFILKNQLIY